MISDEIKALRTREKRNQKKEEVLLCRDGLRFDIKTRKKEELKFDAFLPRWSSTFQIT